MLWKGSLVLACSNCLVDKISPCCLALGMPHVTPQKKKTECSIYYAKPCKLRVGCHKWMFRLATIHFFQTTKTAPLCPVLLMIAIFEVRSVFVPTTNTQQRNKQSHRSPQKETGRESNESLPLNVCVCRSLKLYVSLSSRICFRCSSSTLLVLENWGIDSIRLVLPTAKK
jgi:hypothetical protein